LTPRQYRDLLVIAELYRQQFEMYKTGTHRVEDRIVSIAQPHVRPIVRGKASADVEFGAKVAVSRVDGCFRIDTSMSITIGEAESAKFWLSVLNELKNRGLKDIFVLCADGLSGIKEAIAAAYPMTEHQRCIVHVVRNTLRYVSDKDKKAFAADPKTIYRAPDEEQGRARLTAVTQVWEKKYPGCMRRWEENWDVISPMFKFSQAVRKVIYTINAIESLNSGYRRLNRARSVFSSSSALLKALYLATFELTKKWSLPLRNWGQVHSELAVMYPGRMA
jgi:transposase-like protein